MEEVEEKNKFELEGPSEKYEPANSGEETLMEKESMKFKKEGFVIEKSIRKAETNPYGGLTKLERLLREKALKKPMLKLVHKSKKGVKGEKLMGSAMKGQIYFRGKRRNKLHETKSDEIGESSVKFIDYEREPRREIEEFGSKKKMNNPMDRYLNRTYTYEGDSDSDSDLPEIFKELIEFVEGKNTKLVMQKRLSYDDLSMSCYKSFSIQVEESFLTKEEKEALNCGEEIEVVFIEPIISVSHVTLRKHPGTTFRWGMNWNELVIEDELRAETTYLLILQWSRVASENDLRVGTQVQLWSFRIHEKLGFVLVKVAIDVEVEDDDWLDIDAI